MNNPEASFARGYSHLSLLFHHHLRCLFTCPDNINACLNRDTDKVFCGGHTCYFAAKRRVDHHLQTLRAGDNNGFTLAIDIYASNGVYRYCSRFQCRDGALQRRQYRTVGIKRGYYIIIKRTAVQSVHSVEETGSSGLAVAELSYKLSIHNQTGKHIVH